MALHENYSTTAFVGFRGIEWMISGSLIPNFDTRGYIAWIMAYLAFLSSIIVAHYKTVKERKRLKEQTLGYEEAKDVEMTDKLDTSPKSAVLNAGKSSPRYGFIDTVRGWTICFITFYHIMWNLAEEGFVPPIPDRNPTTMFRGVVEFWIFFALGFIVMTEVFYQSIFAGYAGFAFVTAMCIPWHYWPSQVSGVGLIMFCIGLSSFVQNENGFKWEKIYSRIRQLVLVSLCITVATYIVFPTQFVYFGAVHCITLLSIIHLPFIAYPKFAFLGSLAILLHYSFFGGTFILDVPVWRPTVDYMPWFSNLGYLLFGVHFGYMGWHRENFLRRCLWGRFKPGIQWEDTVFGFLGRHSLFIFVAHQIVIFPLVKLAALVW
jgi:uncharacterized membrane protein